MNKSVRIMLWFLPIAFLFPATTWAEDIPTISWEQAKHYIGKEVCVVGKVVRGYKSKDGNVFLNFTPEYKGTLSIFIKPSVSKRMTSPPEKAYQGRMVRVRGVITDFKGEPSLTLQDPGEITILADGTPLPTSTEGSADSTVSAGQHVTHPVSGPIQPEEYLPTIPWTMAQDFIGKEALIVGKIVRTARIPNGPVFLNFDKDHQNTLSVHIRANYVDNFPLSPDKMYKGKMVQIRSFIGLFEDKPSISVSSDKYIQILPDDTPLPQEPVIPVTPAPTMAAKPGATIRLAEYNVLNLFDDWDDPYHVDEPSDMKPREQMESLAKGIRAVNADVLVLIEVENIGMLRLFLRVFLPEMGYEPVLIEGNDPRGIDVAVLSRFPVGPVTTYQHVRFPEGENGRLTTFRRDLLRVPIFPPGVPPFDVFAVHYKSKGGQEEGGIEARLAEAKATRAVVDEILKNDPQARFFIAGDFNDTIDSEPLKILLGGGATALRTFALEMPKEKQVTYNEEPFRSMIDFFLFSPALAKLYVPKSYDTVPGSPTTTGSDHNTLVCQFRAR